MRLLFMTNNSCAVQKTTPVAHRWLHWLTKWCHMHGQYSCIRLLSDVTWQLVFANSWQKPPSQMVQNSVMWIDWKKATVSGIIAQGSGRDFNTDNGLFTFPCQWRHHFRPISIYGSENAAPQPLWQGVSFTRSLNFPLVTFYRISERARLPSTSASLPHLFSGIFHATLQSAGCKYEDRRRRNCPLIIMCCVEYFYSGTRPPAILFGPLKSEAWWNCGGKDSWVYARSSFQPWVWVLSMSRIFTQDLSILSQALWLLSYAVIPWSGNMSICHLWFFWSF